MKIGDFLRLMSARNPQTRRAPSKDPRPFIGEFINPGQPIASRRPNAFPRSFDYTTGINSNTTPRSEFPVIPSFANLHGYKLVTPILRACVDFRGTQLKAVPWTVEAREEFAGKADRERIRQAQRLLERPDVTTGYSWEQWISPVVDEVLTTDALSLIPIRSRGGKIVSFNARDGQTFKPLIDEAGDRPLPPWPAFQQYIKGAAYAEFTTEELYYRPFRPRTWCTYGDSRVEAVFLVAVLSCLHDSRISSFFTDGNIPEVAALMDPNVMDSVTEQEFMNWQAAMDAIAGQPTKQRRVHLFPRFVRDVKPVKDFEFKKDLPEWLVRIICVELGVPYHLFTSDTNRATAKEVNEVIVEMPFRHDLMGFKRLHDEMLEMAGFGDLEFVWRPPPDYRKEAVEGLTILVAAGIITIAEARNILGFVPGATMQQPEGELELETPAADGAAAPTPFTPQQIAAATKMMGGLNPARLAGKARISRERAAREILKPIGAELERQRQLAITKAVEMAKHRGRVVQGA